MGNTKNIWFEGRVKAGFPLADFSCESLLRASRGNYCAVHVEEKGYLEQGGEVWVLGIIHTFSLSGADVIDYLKLRMEGVIGFHDVDQWDVYQPEDPYSGVKIIASP